MRDRARRAPAATVPGAVALTTWGVRLAGAAAILIGGFWLAAWLWGFAARWSAVPGQITMKTNMALGQLLAGVALLLLEPLASAGERRARPGSETAGGGRSGPALRRAAGSALALVVMAIGALTLGQHLFHYDLGIDQLLAREGPGATATLSPNRMGYPGSVSLALLGAGLLVLAGRGRALASYLGLAVCLVNLVPAVGFLYGIGILYSQPLTGIAWPTVVVLSALGLGLVVAQRDNGPMALLLREDAGGTLLRRMLPAVIVLPVALGYMRLHGESLGLYDTSTGRGLLVIAVVLAFSFILWRSAARLSGQASAARAAEEALRGSEARYRNLFENMSEEVHFWELVREEDGRIQTWRLVDANPPTLETWGRATIDEIRGKTTDEIFGPGSTEHYRPVVEKIMAEGAPHSFEDYFPNLDKYFRFTSVPFGERFITTGADITSIKKAELALRAKEAELTEAQRVAHVGSWHWDAASDVTTGSDEMLRIFGFDPATQTMPTFSEQRGRCYAVEEWERIRVAALGALETGTGYELDVRALRNGTEIWVTTRGEVVRDATGLIAGLRGTVQDITERKQGEEELQKAKAAAEEANRQKDHFLAVLGHELRNPLAPISNSVALLKRIGPSAPALQRAHDMIDRQVAHMTRLIDDLLDVSRIARGKITLRKEALDLTEVVQRAVEDHRPLLEAHGLTLEVTAPGGLVCIDGDAARITQIVGNLLMNANKFTDRGGHVALSLEVDGGHDAVIRVRDTGIGMDPDTLSRLFEPFAQADRSVDRSGGGLGLGLALVKGLTELHGGKVRATSDGTGRGAEFVVCLPGGARSPGAGTEQAASTGRAPRSHRILIIEDNPDVAESLRLLLELSGNTVVVAHSGPEGLGAARAHRPEVILCDIGLPGMDGYGVAKAIRQTDGLRSVCLIAMTGYGQEEDRRRAVEAGFDHHLTKPADPVVLEGLLASLDGT